jgi:ferric-chelate reductase (NADPH)
MSNTKTNSLPRNVTKPGLFERAVTRLFMRATRITNVRTLTPHFRFIDFEGTALRDAPWEPGHKIQVKLAEGLLTRTYTPLYWDRSLGSTRILAYAHGSGPGSDWTLRVRPGDAPAIMGPRRSLILAELPRTVVLFGDETSFGLASTLRSSLQSGCELNSVFEATSKTESQLVLDQLGLYFAVVIERQPMDAHLSVLEQAVLQFATETTVFILSGKSSSIRHLHRLLRSHGVPSERLRAKVYWAPGKAGLD